MSFSTVSQDQPHQFRAQAADGAARSIREAEPELEKLVRGGYATVVAWERRGEADRAAYNMARLRPAFVDGDRPAVKTGEGSLWFACRALREGFIAPQLKLAVIPDHRMLRRRRAERPDTRPGRALAAFTDLRKATSSCTWITASAASRASTRRPSPTSRAITWSSNTATGTASSSPPTSSTS